MRGSARRRGLLVAGLVVALLVAVAGAASAHPLGNFTTNTYAGLVVSPAAVEIDYVLDLAEVPAFQTIERLGRGPDGHLDTRASERYESEQCAALAAAVDLDVGGEPVPLTVTDTDLTLTPGQAGLDTLRLECRLLADTKAPHGERTVTVVDRNFPRRRGWREMTAVGDGMTITDSDVPTDSLSERLTTYPEDLLQSPLRRREAHVRARPGNGASSTDGLPAEPGTSLFGGVERLTTSFTSLVASQELTAAFALLAFATALLLGAIHSLAPGHGKTVMAAYLVSSRGTSRQALGLGLTVAVTHTAGVLGLGVVLSASQTIAPERLYPYLGVASGVLFAAVGGLLLRRALRNRTGHRDGHGHGHGDGHDHGHGPSLTWRGLLAPGLAGGLVPSPSALVVLLGGIAIGRAWFGVVLVTAYGLGMAATLVGAGHLLLRTRVRVEARLAARPSTGRLARVNAALPVATASLIVVGGLTIAARAVVAV